MRPGQAVLLPASPRFVGLSLAGALTLNLLLGLTWPEYAHGLPDFLVLSLTFWAIAESRWVGLPLAFVFGVLMDVHASALLGQHALAYSTLVFLALGLQRRLTFFTASQQALQLAPVFVVAHALQWLVRAIGDDQWPSGWALLAPLLETLLWPACSWLLQWPQRRSPDPDENRPL